jgi:plasmid stabilization system protein ParE
MELDRHKKKLQPPDPDKWNKQIYAIRVFHQLIYDTDPNMTNILITKDWRVWMIDFTRAFRWMRELENPRSLEMCDRTLLANLRKLSKESLTARLSRWLGPNEIEGVAARAAKIVELFDRKIAEKGEAKVLYDFSRTCEPCGLGL